MEKQWMPLTAGKEHLKLDQHAFKNSQQKYQV